MRHRKSFNHLSRTASHRKAMLSNMASQLIMHKRINTTLAKAKALRKYVEPLITKSKVDSTHSRRVVFSYLQNKEAISELFREVSQKIIDRPGGYTRILKTGFRKGDGAEMCFIELVDFNENMLVTAEEETQKSTRRSRRGGKKKTDTVAETPDAKAQEAVAEQEVKAEKPVEDSTESKEETTEQPKQEAVKEEIDDQPVEEKKEEKPAEKKEEKKEEPKAEGEKAEKDQPKKPESKKEEDLSSEKDTKAEAKVESKKEDKQSDTDKDKKAE